MSDAFNQMLAQGPTPIKFADPVNQMAQLMQLKNAQQTGVVNQMAIDKGNRQMADQAAYRNMLAQPGFNSNDPATRAQVLGLGRGEDLTSLDASAKTQRDLAKTAYDERAASYKAGAPFNATPQQYLDYFDAGAQDPVLGAHWENNEGGIAPMRARLVQVLSTPEGLAHIREVAGGQTPQDVAELAKTDSMRKYYDARAAAAGRPGAANVPQPPSGYRFGPDGNLIAISGGPADRPVAPVKKDRETVGGVPFTVNEDGTFSPIVDPTTGKHFVKASTVPALTPLQQRKETRQKQSDQEGIERLQAGLRSMSIPIYGLDNPAEMDATGKVIKAAGKTPGLLSPGVKTSGIERLQSLVPSIPGSDAARAESLLESVNNQMKSVGRDLLTSDDQGKLGNFAVKEWQIAADAVAKLDPRKDPDGWKIKLDEIVRRLEKRIKLKQDQFEELYLDVEPSNAPPADGAGQTNNPVPEGLSPEDWNLLTPTEQATWKR